MLSVKLFIKLLAKLHAKLLAKLFAKLLAKLFVKLRVMLFAKLLVKLNDLDFSCLSQCLDDTVICFLQSCFSFWQS